MAAYERQMKQQFLRQEILEQGYDGMDFQDFCQEKYPQLTDDIDLFSFQQLKLLVSEFKQLQATQKRSVYAVEKKSTISNSSKLFEDTTKEPQTSNDEIRVSGPFQI